MIAQALCEWTAQAIAPIHAFAVCSDTKVGRNKEDVGTHDLAYPATTDATKLVSAANALNRDRRTLVFSTYQSSHVVAEAQQQDFGAFDLIICDEAHRITGLTLPVFQALFADTGFLGNNAVGKALQTIVDRLDTAAVDSETEGLTAFYDNVRERIRLAKSDKSKQDIIRNLYDTFFHGAFPRMAERLGIVYTPVQVVDFILKSADAALRQNFDQHLASCDVRILDPFAGTGTFLVQLIQSGLIEANALRHKFGHELYANELVLLAYYIASVNIETTYHAATGEYRPFGSMVLADTFQMTEKGDLVDKIVLPGNNARTER